MRSPLTDLALVMILMSLLGACGDSDPVSNDHDAQPGRSDNNAIHFVDFALDAGVNSFPGIAVSTVDLNDDGLPDLTVGSRHNVSIYQNAGDGSFVDISWVLPANDLPGTTIVYADIDDDQDLDLFLGNQEGKSMFLINNGEAGFSYGDV
ncbi:MAG TPA: VCBS repeat-containing protein, partial [Myxococcales bacterium]|nr:VCBS repeat-containing protein [Myxococcales bacterium]